MSKVVAGPFETVTPSIAHSYITPATLDGLIRNMTLVWGQIPPFFPVGPTTVWDKKATLDGDGRTFAEMAEERVEVAA